METIESTMQTTNHRYHYGITTGGVRGKNTEGEINENDWESNENEEPQEKGSEQNVEHEHTEEIETEPKYNQEDSGDIEVITKLKKIPE